VRALFVDDESRVLDGIRRNLFAQGLRWETAFATSGAQALHLLAEKSYDVIVTDMRMAPMDGVVLLKCVRDGWPSMLRIVLSGHTHAGTPILALQLAHQLLSKPCDTLALVDAIRSGMAMQSLLADPTLRDIVGRLKSLPAAPKIHADITATLLKPGCDARRIAEIIGRDPGLALKVLHMANSAFFPANRPASDVYAAVARIGMDNVNNLVLANEVFDTAAHGRLAETLCDRGLRASRIAAHIARDRPDSGMVATAALLTDVGYLVSGTNVIDPTGVMSDQAHAEIGAHLLALWGLPMPIVEAVAYHHAPARIPRDDFGLHGIVHVAAALAIDEDPHEGFLRTHGMDVHLADWKAACASAGGSVGAQ
jgi:HD-like signal output (HDOD) protein/CheY-like chemotaxis protein